MVSADCSGSSGGEVHVRNAIDESEGFGWSGNAEAAPVAGVGEVRDSNLLFQWSSSSEMMPIEPLWRYFSLSRE